ncbi:MAG: hypothetical protein PHD67_05635 [Oscillospiraceae bacterium]|nr:hypothetical protein [Oscillospiraceae bacterium]
MNTANVLHSAQISPAWFNQDDLGQLPPLTRILFFGLRCMANAQGELRDDPNEIGSRILPHDHLCTEDIETMLNELEQARLIARSEQEGKPVIQVNGLRRSRRAR